MLIATFQRMMDYEKSRDTRIVLDALDECSTRKELLSWLASPTTEAIHILLTSRTEDDIETSLTEWIPPAAIVPIYQKPVDDDIRRVVHTTIATDKELQRWKDSQDVCEEIETTLMEKADGM